MENSDYTNTNFPKVLFQKTTGHLWGGRGVFENVSFLNQEASSIRFKENLFVSEFIGYAYCLEPMDHLYFKRSVIYYYNKQDTNLDELLG